MSAGTVWSAAVWAIILSGSGEGLYSGEKYAIVKNDKYVSSERSADFRIAGVRSHTWISREHTAAGVHISLPKAQLLAFGSFF